jgi:hypothetical protein
MGEEYTAQVLPVLFPMGGALLVASSFSLIRSHPNSHPSIILMYGLLALNPGMMLKEGIELAVRVTEASEKFIEVGSTSPPLILMMGKAKKEREMFFRSCKSFQMTIGNSFTLRRDTFPKILNDVVIALIIHLLIAF